jgi:Helix-turn-helix domain
MAGTIGVGSALRRAREIREITLDEAARDTKLRTDQLRALEDEDFERLGDPVYARAMLRTYAQYLGLRPDRVLSVYARHSDDIVPPSPPGKLGRVEQGLAASRIRDNQKFLLIAAAVVLVALIAVGIVSRGGAPAPATIETPTARGTVPTSVTPTTTVDVRITATGPVEVTAVIDGTEQGPTILRPGESIALTATEELRLTATDGGAIEIAVDGKDRGTPGVGGAPWSRTFTPRGAA